ncbi:GntR family transcriptional regulator [Rhodococcus koreensis]
MTKPKGLTRAPAQPGPRDGSAALLPVASISRREGVIAEIKRAIVLGSLQPGEKLTEVQLATSLNVSRPTVREALNQLSQEGLLVQEPYRGLRVAHLSEAALLDIAEVRVAIDMQAMTAILSDPTGERLERVMQGWRDFERFAFDPDPVVQHEAHLRFHRSIWAASDNYLLLKLWPVTEAHITIALAQDQFTRSDPERAYAVHSELIATIQTRDLEKIRAAFVAHTVDSAKELIALMQEAAAPTA